MAHRLELSFKDAASKNIYYKQLDGFLLRLYYFYHMQQSKSQSIKREPSKAHSYANSVKG